MGLNYRKWSLWPPILSNVGTVLNEVYVSGRLKLNDLDEVNVENPTNDQVLIYEEATSKWKNEDLGSVLSGGMLDEIRMFGGDNVNTIFPGGIGTGEYEGWFLCDGTNDTLDLRNQFVLGRDPAKITEPIGYEGGYAEVTLTGEESGMPAHSHTKGTLTVPSSGAHGHTWSNGKPYRAGGERTRSGGGHHVASNELGTTDIASSGAHTHSITGDTGTRALMDAAQAHTNIPPYTIVAFIQYKG